MKKILEDILLTGLGTLVVTKDKAKELVETMIEQGDMTRQEGKELLNKFKNKTEKESSKLSSLFSDELTKRLKKAGFVTRDRVEELENRINELEDKINNLKSDKTVSGENEDI
ncbi:MAG: phasin family protein [Halanaerobiaceae bacterium]